MYLPCMGSDLDDEGLETPRRIGDWVESGSDSQGSLTLGRPPSILRSITMPLDAERT